MTLGGHAQGHPARSRTGLSHHASPSFWAAWWAPRLVVRVHERIQTPREFRSPTGGEPAVELHEECLPVLLELRSAVLQGPRFCPHFVRWEADHQSSGNPALAILINVVRPGCYRSGPFMFSVRYTYALSPRPRNARFRLSLFHFDADYGARRPFEFRTKRQSIAVHPPVSPRPLLRYLRQHKFLPALENVRPLPSNQGIGEQWSRKAA